jgi:hypothetical protein
MLAGCHRFLGSSNGGQNVETGALTPLATVSKTFISLTNKRK